jgi:hypothetical protein
MKHHVSVNIHKTRDGCAHVVRRRAKPLNPGDLVVFMYPDGTRIQLVVTKGTYRYGKCSDCYFENRKCPRNKVKRGPFTGIECMISFREGLVFKEPADILEEI